MPSYHKESIVHIVYIPFTGIGTGDFFRNDEWLEYRIRFFIAYTLQSLKFQTNKNFMIWLSFRPEDEGHYLLQGLFKALKEANLSYISTYDGLMYYDDKFSSEPVKIFKNILRIVRGCNRIKQWNILIPSVKGILKNKNLTLVSRVGNSVKQLEKYLHGVNWVYLTRLDSDDMLHKDAIDSIQKIEPHFHHAISFKNGWIYNTNTGDVAHYTPNENPPFHTIMFPGGVFFNPDAHVFYYDSFQSHEDIPKIFKTTEINGMYCVNIHSLHNQISTIWDHPFRGELVTNPSEILTQFGLPFN